METQPAKPPRTRRPSAELLPEAEAHLARAKQRAEAAANRTRRIAFAASKAGRKARSKAIINVGLTVLLTLDLGTKLDSPEEIAAVQDQFLDRFRELVGPTVEIREPAKKST